MTDLVLTPLLAAALAAAPAQGKPAARQDSTRQPAAAQQQPAAPLRRDQMQRDKLRPMLAAVGVSVGEGATPPRARASREVRILWAGEAAGQAGQEFTSSPADGQMRVTAEGARDAGPPPVPRSLEMSPDHLLVVAVDAESRLVWWTLITDPRVLRAEGPDADGRMSGQVIYRRAAEFSVEFPDDPAIAELRVYKPAASAEGTVLRQVGAVGLSARR